MSKCDEISEERWLYFKERLPKESLDFALENLLCIEDLDNISVEGKLGDQVLTFVTIKFQHCGIDYNKDGECATKEEWE